MARVYVLTDACKGVRDCGICRFVCPRDVFGVSDTLNEKGFFPPLVAAEEACTGCENCMIYCPDMAIIVEKD
ncbi:MAG: ferredoxin family protein [Deltaproteobacteria bacterium]|nr:ferredoxin family protein [Deltaproteobacteria bacterium]